MTYKSSLFLLFAGACVSVYGQELQSPQINQNAIFANPGLAGSKGRTRVCASLGTTHINETKGQTYYDLDKSQYYNSSISFDGLIFKSTVGAGMYIQNNHYSRKYSVNETFPNPAFSTSEEDKVSYTTTTIGAIAAPKFYLRAKKANKEGASISPSFSIGIRNDNLTNNHSYTSRTLPDSINNYTAHTSHVCLSNVVVGLLYNTKNGYAGVKTTLLNSGNKETYILTSFVLARNFHYNNDPTSDFSFTPQLFFSFLWNGYNTVVDDNTYRESYRVNMGSNVILNLDFRYKKIIIGQYVQVAYYRYLKTGISLGYQLNDLKLIVNFSPPIFSDIPATQLFLSVNILLNNKKSSIVPVHEN